MCCGSIKPVDGSASLDKLRNISALDLKIKLNEYEMQFDPTTGEWVSKWS